jgi:hypothetical protein
MTISDTLVSNARTEHYIFKKWEFVDGLINWIHEHLPSDDDTIEVHWKGGGDEWDRLQIEGFLRYLLKDIPDDTRMVDPAPHTKGKDDFYTCHFRPKDPECAFCPDKKECLWERNGGRR